MNIYKNINKKLNKTILLPFIALAILLPSCTTTPTTESELAESVVEAEQYLSEKNTFKLQKCLLRLHKKLLHPNMKN